MLTNGYQGGYRLELCPELRNPGLLTVPGNTVSMDEEGLTRPPPLSEELLAVDGHWGRESHSSLVWPL